MEENKNKNQTLVIVGMVALVMVLCLSVKMIFEFLEDTLPQPAAQPPAISEQVPVEEAGPNFCPYCGEELFDGFRWEQYCPDCGKQVTNGGT